MTLCHYCHYFLGDGDLTFFAPLPRDLIAFFAAGFTSLKLTFSRIPGVDHIAGPLPWGNTGVGWFITSGITGSGPFAVEVCPDGVGSVAETGISGDSGTGRSKVEVTGTSWGDCRGSGGASGAPGNGIAADPVSIPNIVGWSGAFTNGDVVAIAARACICTAGPGGSEIAEISLSVNTIGLPGTNFPVFPFGRLRGGNGGGTFQSDKLLFWAIASFKEQARAINVKIKIGSSLVRPRILSVFFCGYDVFIQ